jgi:hypothetical protein
LFWEALNKWRDRAQNNVNSSIYHTIVTSGSNLASPFAVQRQGILTQSLFMVLQPFLCPIVVSLFGSPNGEAPLIPIASLADNRLTKQIGDLILKCAEQKRLVDGVKETTKMVKEKQPGICVLSGNVWPMDIITHPCDVQEPVVSVHLLPDQGTDHG